MNETIGTGQDRAKVPVLPAVFFLPMSLAVLLQVLTRTAAFPLPESFGGALAKWLAGGFLALLGLAIPIMAIGQFRKFGQSADVRKATLSIIRTGPYRFTRNPMYLGLLVFQTGVGLAMGSLWVFAALVPLIPMIRYLAIAPEEAYLEAKFGDEYRAFKTSVRRWM